jgi:mannonate dehydratase
MLDQEAAARFEYTPAYLPVNRTLDGTVHDW